MLFLGQTRDFHEFNRVYYIFYFHTLHFQYAWVILENVFKQIKNILNNRETPMPDSLFPVIAKHHLFSARFVLKNLLLEISINKGMFHSKYFPSRTRYKNNKFLPYRKGCMELDNRWNLLENTCNFIKISKIRKFHNNISHYLTMLCLSQSQF